MIVGVGCWRGTGATTMATLLCAAMAARGDRPWLIEADPAGGVLAARLDLAGAAGLERVAVPDDPSAPAEERFGAACAEIAGVRVVPAPGDPFRAWACHVPRRPWTPLLRELADPVVVDVGTLRGGTPAGPLLAQLDVLLLAATSDAVSIAATLEWVELHGRVSPNDAGLALDVTRLVIVDLPTPTSIRRADSVADLGERFAAWLPWSPSVVELVERGTGLDDRRLRRQPLVREVVALADRVHAWTTVEVAA